MKPTGKWVRKPPNYMNIGAGFGTTKATGSKKRGIDYHRAVFKLLRAHSRAALPGWQCLIEPWYKNLDTQRHRQPDAVLLYPEESVAIVIEVKLNWKDGRDVKLIDEYIHIVKAAEGLDCVWPLLITKCLRGYQHPPILALKDIDRCQTWLPGDPTPLMLLI